MTRLVRGVDVGVDNGAISQSDWVQMASDGIEFAMLRCSDDHDPVDPTYDHNVNCARGAVRIFAYHVSTFLPGIDAALLARNHFAQSGNLGALSTDGSPVLDFETPAPQDWATHGVTAQELVDGACAYGTEMAALIGRARKPLLYCYDDFMVELARGGADLAPLAAIFDLWLASYPYGKGVMWPPDDAAIPTHAPWAESTIWQCTDGRVGGFRVPNGCPTDTNVMLATTLAALTES